MTSENSKESDRLMTERETPAEPALEPLPGPHWLTRWDQNDGEPYGEVCHCEISTDHDGNGDPFP